MPLSATMQIHVCTLFLQQGHNKQLFKCSKNRFFFLSVTRPAMAEAMAINVGVWKKLEK